MEGSVLHSGKKQTNKQTEREGAMRDGEKVETSMGGDYPAAGFQAGAQA